MNGPSETMAKKCKIVLNTVHKMKKSNFVDSYNDELKLFWFSQYIGKERGVESILKAMSILNNPKIKLTLLGNLSKINRIYFEKLRIDLNLNKDQIVYEEPIKSSELEVFSSGFHIGLCTEESGISNVKYCLANKIFSYLIAGNALVLSDTEAQIEFTDRYNDIGSIYTQKNVEHLSVILNNYYTNRKLLDFHRSNALEFGVNTLNWDKESTSLVKFYKESI
jgi:glycosyltransferase involved in cell wall biosynthesis